MQIVITSDIIKLMTDNATFHMNVANLRARKQDSQVEISMVFKSEYLHEPKVAISGFPRAIMAEQSPQST